MGPGWRRASPPLSSWLCYNAYLISPTMLTSSQLAAYVTSLMLDYCRYCNNSNQMTLLAGGCERVAGAVGLNDCAPRHGREALCPLAVPGLYFNPCGADRAGTTYMSTVLYINATMVGQFSGWVSCFTNLPRRAPDSRGLERISLVGLVGYCDGGTARPHPGWRNLVRSFGPLACVLSLMATL